MDEFEKQVNIVGLPTTINAADWLSSEPPAPNQILVDTFDAGDKVAIIGSAKVRKSFFLLQGVLSLAAGRDFLIWKVPEAKRVFHVQFEIQPHHFHRRVKRMARALGINPSDLEDHLQILNARGLGIIGPEGIETISKAAKGFQPAILSLDPLYKITSGGENDPVDMKLILNAFDKLANETGAAIPYVHHDAKGFSGDRILQDRGAGSNVLSRDYDAGIILTPHVSVPGAVVVETLLRNYQPREPFTIQWTENDETGGYCFVLMEDIYPTKLTSARRKLTTKPPLDIYVPAALALLEDGPMSINVFMDSLRAKTDLTHERSTSFKNWALSGPRPVLDTISSRSRGHNEKIIGTWDQILHLRNDKKK